MLEVGDGRRLAESKLENLESTVLIMDLGFVVSPLVASSAYAVEAGDTEEAGRDLRSILDECVRVSPALSSFVTGDKGLRRFIGLFECLGPLSADDMEGSLPMVYAELTTKTTDTEEELIRYLGVINNALYDIGVLRPDVKDNVDDMLNMKSGKAALEKLNEALSEPEETIAEALEEPDEADRESGQAEEEPHILKEIMESNVEDSATSSETIGQEEVLVTSSAAEKKTEEVSRSHVEESPEPDEVLTEPDTSEIVTSPRRQRRRKSADTTSYHKAKKGRKKREVGRAGA